MKSRLARTLAPPKIANYTTAAFTIALIERRAKMLLPLEGRRGGRWQPGETSGWLCLRRGLGCADATAHAAVKTDAQAEQSTIRRHITAHIAVEQREKY